MKKKNILTTAGLLVLPLLLSACSRRTSQSGTLKAPTSGPYFWIYKWIGTPLQNIMVSLSHTLGGSNGAGWAIVIITLIIRIILMPLMLNQQHKSIVQQQKMSRIQPQMKLIQESLKIKGLTPEQQMQISNLQREIYSKNNISMVGGIGCLPLLIQMPIMIGIYQAVAYSSALAKSTFFGISLSQKSIVLAIIATILAFIQSYISLIGIPEEQKQTMKTTMYVNPIMTLFFAMSFSGALALYWAAGNLVMVIQQLITTFVIQPRAKKRIEEELKNKPIVEVVTQEKIDSIVNTTPASDSKQSSEIIKQHENLRKRNQGKQKHHK